MPLPGDGGNTTLFLSVTPEVQTDGVEFWKDLVGCTQDTVLRKTAQQVVVPGELATPYRPYSKTCPPPPPPPHTPRWVAKTLCGTRSLYTFLATSYNGVTMVVTQTVYDIPGVDLPTVNSGPYDPSKPTTQPQLVMTEPYCVTVNVYE